MPAGDQVSFGSADDYKETQEKKKKKFCASHLGAAAFMSRVRDALEVDTSKQHAPLACVLLFLQRREAIATHVRLLCQLCNTLQFQWFKVPAHLPALCCRALDCSCSTHNARCPGCRTTARGSTVILAWARPATLAAHSYMRPYVELTLGVPAVSCRSSTEKAALSTCDAMHSFATASLHGPERF